MSVGLKQCDMVLYRPDSRLVLLLLLCIKIWIPVTGNCTQLTPDRFALACSRKLDHRTLLLQARLSAIGRGPDTLCLGTWESTVQALGEIDSVKWICQEEDGEDEDEKKGKVWATVCECSCICRLRHSLCSMR